VKRGGAENLWNDHIAASNGVISLPVFCVVFPDHSSFSVLRETSMTFPPDYFKKLKCYLCICTPRFRPEAYEKLEG
jgi:hypothetical protein